MKDRYGRDYNPEKIWGVELGHQFGKQGPIHWAIWKKYKTQAACLQALAAYKKRRWGGRSSSDGGKTWTEVYDHWRPVHVYYPTDEKPPA